MLPAGENVRALRALIYLTVPDQLHLGSPPTPLVPGALFKLRRGFQSLPELCWRSLDLQLSHSPSHAHGWPWTLLMQTPTHGLISQLDLRPASCLWTRQ